MATSPVNHHRQHQNELNRRPQHRHPNPLHNFSYPFLKWGSRSHVNTVQRSRRSSDPPPSQDQAHRRRRSPEPMFRVGADSREVDEEARRVAERDGVGNCRRSPIGPRTVPNRVDLLSKSPEVKRRSRTPADGEDPVDEEMAEGDILEEAHRIWNLRPRKCGAKNGKEICGASGGLSSKHQDVVVHAQNGGGGCGSQDAVVVVAQQADVAPKSLRLRGMVEAHGGVEKKKERPKLWISLSKEEIEEDIFIMTGSRPARRPKKRPKSVQKQLDILFPGWTLVGASADTLKIPDSPPKR